MSDHERQGTAHDSGAAGHELQGRARAPTLEASTMPSDTETMREDETVRAARHASEIQDIIDEHTALAVGKDGRELIAVREKCSRLVREACTRHVTENNTLPPRAEGADDNGDLGGEKPADDDPSRMRTAG